MLNEQGRTLSAINLGTDHLVSIDEKIGTLGREQEGAERKDADRMTRMAFGVMTEDQVNKAMAISKGESSTST